MCVCITEIIDQKFTFTSLVQVDSEACRKGLSEEMLSTDIAYYLVKKGVSKV